MICPDCGSKEVLKGSDGIFCKKCGLELDDPIITSKKGKGTSGFVKLPGLVFKIDPKIELFAFRLGLKHNKLSSDWHQQLGFKLKSGLLKPELKKKVLGLITIAIEKKKPQLEVSKSRIENNWKMIEKKYFFGIEKIMDYSWENDSFDCYLSLVCGGGFHNSSKSHIIVQHRWDKASNYVISHELFHIIFRQYVTRFFREKYDIFDEDLSEAIVNFILLVEMKALYPDMKFSFEMYKMPRHRKLAQILYPLWKKRSSFKGFMISAYKALDHEKHWISY